MENVTYNESYSKANGKYFYPMMYINSKKAKPTEKIEPGSKITETDTGKVYIYDEEEGWTFLFCLKEEE